MPKARPERTLGPYIHAVWKHWKLLALDVVLGIVGLVDSVSRFRTTTQVVPKTPARLVHHSILPGWAWIVAFGTVLVMVQFRAWRDLYKAPLTPEHTNALRQIARHVGESLRGEKITYRTDARQNDYVRRMFQNHFPELAVLLDQWDALAEKERVATATLGIWLHDEIYERFPFSEQGDWYAPTIEKQVVQHVTNSFRLDHVPEPPVAWSSGVILWKHDIIRDFGGGYDEGKPAPPAVEKLMDELRSWVVSIGISPYRVRVVEVNAERVASRGRILAALSALAETELWGRCDACRPGRKSAEYEAITHA
jgi:hypothetical protein